MNTVNIRPAPIKRIHQRGLEVMSKKKRHDTRKKKRFKKIEDTRPWETRHFYKQGRRFQDKN